MRMYFGYVCIVCIFALHSSCIWFSYPTTSKIKLGQDVCFEFIILSHYADCIIWKLPINIFLKKYKLCMIDQLKCVFISICFRQELIQMLISHGGGRWNPFSKTSVSRQVWAPFHPATCVCVCLFKAHFCISWKMWLAFVQLFAYWKLCMYRRYSTATHSKSTLGPSRAQKAAKALARLSQSRLTLPEEEKQLLRCVSGAAGMRPWICSPSWWTQAVRWCLGFPQNTSL